MCKFGSRRGCCRPSKSTTPVDDNGRNQLCNSHTEILSSRYVQKKPGFMGHACATSRMRFMRSNRALVVAYNPRAQIAKMSARHLPSITITASWRVVVMMTSTVLPPLRVPRETVSPGDPGTSACTNHRVVSYYITALVQYGAMADCAQTVLSSVVQQVGLFEEFLR